MNEKIRNWLEEHETIYGVCLFAAGLFAISFGGAYLGAEKAITNSSVSVSLYNTGDGVKAVINE